MVTEYDIIIISGKEEFDMPRWSKNEKRAFDSFMQFLEGVSTMNKTVPWIWLDGMTTEKVYDMYVDAGGEKTKKGFTTTLLRKIGRNYLGTEVKRVNGKIQRVYVVKKIT